MSEFEGYKRVGTGVICCSIALCGVGFYRYVTVSTFVSLFIMAIACTATVWAMPDKSYPFRHVIGTCFLIVNVWAMWGIATYVAPVPVASEVLIAREVFLAVMTLVLMLSSGSLRALWVLIIAAAALVPYDGASVIMNQPILSFTRFTGFFVYTVMGITDYQASGKMIEWTPTDIIAAVAQTVFMLFSQFYAVAGLSVVYWIYLLVQWRRSWPAPDQQQPLTKVDKIFKGVKLRLKKM